VLIQVTVGSYVGLMKDSTWTNNG